MYGIIWTVVLVLNSFGWSDLSEPLDPLLFIFFVISIMLSFTLGCIFQSYYKIEKDQEILTAVNNRFAKKNNYVISTIFFICLYSLNFIYARDVPLISSLLFDSVSYIDFQGIPTLGVFITTATEVYGVTLIYQFVRHMSFQLGWQVLSIVALYLLQLNRNALMLFTIAFIIFYLCCHKVKVKTLIGAGVLGMVVLFLIGVLGNVRQLSEWNDSSYISQLAVINDKYPFWLPKQYIWAYIYIVSPIVNLNYNVVNHLYEVDSTNLAITFIPDFIQKRISPDYSPQIILVRRYFNVSTVYASCYKYGGILGILLMQGLLMAETLFVTYLCGAFRHRVVEKNVMLMMQVYFMIMTFFDNVFRFTGTILLIYYCVILLACPRIRIECFSILRGKRV